ncbi:unnamed protein product [Dicrocoelium dendriticum]|nr:unnamed protein product [Dicrocoelium dendriticum]
MVHSTSAQAHITQSLSLEWQREVCHMIGLKFAVISSVTILRKISKPEGRPVCGIASMEAQQESVDISVFNECAQPIMRTRGKLHQRRYKRVALSFTMILRSKYNLS